MTRASVSPAILTTLALALAACGTDTAGKGNPSGDAGGGAVSDAQGGLDSGDTTADAALATDANVPDATPDAALTDCHGTRSCASLAGLECTAAGCETEMGGSCGGTAAACSTYTGKPARCLLAGCTPALDANQTCSGSPNSCADTNLNLCGAELGPEGCTPSGACSGTADPCPTYTNELQCNLQPGCDWM